ncbi:MAG: hypothetical protein OEO79_13320 [Gemmatimonadota bacterium]|nr:hypothetical protein [Gemmatimonadota bacterium]MDH3422647.1 hypothetical protein [Gemmatimonadota bacterium]
MATLIALAVAGIVLVAVVLPAEYDIDPLGTGEMLGLVVLSGGGAEPAIPVRADGLIDQPAGYRLDTRSFDLEPGEFVEFKYRLEAGQAMVYSWAASYWVRSEMHSEADGAPEGTAEFFEVVERALRRNGSYVAPFPGIHGWYWLNETDRPVTVTLHASGFFEVAAEFREGVPPVSYDIMTTPGDSVP